VLTIEGDRKFVSNVDREHYHRVERGYGAFRRSFTLPASVDAGQVQATYQDGVLTVRLPRREEARPKQIPVNG
jgi:HSP20 family protein